MNLDNFLPLLVTIATQYGGNILLAILWFITGRAIIRWIINTVSTRMLFNKVDRDVHPFLLSMLAVGLNVALLLSIAGVLGIQTASFVAVLGAAGLAIGLALQGSLANFAGGVLLLVFKPFRVGDLITVQGFTGHVDAIRIFDTLLVTLDNKTIVVPNAKLSTETITNVSGRGAIRVDMVFEAGNQNDIDAIQASLEKVVAACPSSLKDREPYVLVTKFTENAIRFDVGIWAEPANYWDVYYYAQGGVYRQFAKDGIEAPKPATLQVAMQP